MSSNAGVTTERPTGSPLPQLALGPTSGPSGRLTGLGPATAARESARLSRRLFPDGEPPLPDSLYERYDRMNLRYAVGVLMDHRDLTRRLAAEAAAPLAG